MLVVPGEEEVTAIIQKEKAATASSETARQRRQRQTRENGQDLKPTRFSYATRLTGAFALTAAMTALIAASILAFVWEDQFQQYTRQNMEILADRTAQQIEQVYADEGGFTPAVLGKVSAASAISSDVAIQVLNADNRVVYDDTWALNRAGETTTSLSLAPSNEQVASAPIMVNGVKVGMVRIWAFSSNALLTQNDIEFRTDSYKAVALAAVIAVMLAIIVGLLAARALVDPVKRVTATAAAVKRGDLSARTGMQGNDEISQLGETFDEMADSIQHDREFERRLTTDVAHELRTPLMGIQATVEAIIDGVFEADEERLAAINSETMRLKRLVEALLNLSRLESGSVPFHEEHIDLVELLAGLIISHEALLEAAELSLVFEYDDKVMVDGDADMIRQATANLISNAVRYNKPGGTVTVGVHKRGTMAAISVRDTGIGIAPEDKELVFSRFWRADAGRDRARGGLGVGLAVVKEIADYHNGKVEVESELDVGTTFTLLIPLSTKDAPKVHKGRSGKIRPQKEKKSGGEMPFKIKKEQ